MIPGAHIAGLLDSLTPPPRLTVSEWADTYRLLNQRSSAEPGRWRTERTPYLRALMDDLSEHSPVQTVTFMKSAQVGGTEAGNNWIAYIIDHAPGPALVVQPTVDMGKRWSRQRLAPMVEDMPSLSARIKPARSRDSGNTTLSKEFDGGLMIITGANSASGLRSMPVKYLMLDEVDAYPHDVDGEGDPVELAEKRTKTFSRKKILNISTPTDAATSRIWRKFQQGDQRHYHVPCPHCEEKQKLEFKHLHWDKTDDGEHLPETARYTCVHCGGLIDEHNKTWMLENGKWVSEGQPNDRHHSYHINSLYSPLGWGSWAEMVEKFLRSKESAELLKTFTNIDEGLPFEEETDKIDRHALADRAEDYPLGELQLGDLVLTAGVDTQPDRFEVVVYAHNQTASRAIDYRVIYGSPDEIATRQALDDYLSAPFKHPSGSELLIKATAIDSGGHNTQTIYDYCRLRKRRGIIAVKGQSQKWKPILGKPTKVDVSIKGKTLPNGAEVWLVGSDSAKSQIYSRLRITNPAAHGYIHFSKQLDDDFYKQLTAEKLATRYVKGHPVQEWVKPTGLRNEVLDCTVYAIAAYHYLGLHRWRPSQWKQLEEKIQPPTGDLFAAADQADDDDQVDAIVNPARPRSRQPGRRPRRRGGFVSSALGGMHGG
jgi:phage terminase large subunit GpA-like protein